MIISYFTLLPLKKRSEEKKFQVRVLSFRLGQVLSLRNHRFESHALRM